jgi:hypothetical protein
MFDSWSKAPQRLIDQLMSQENSVPVSADDLQMDLGCLSKTVPERMTSTDFGYGDTYERLAVAATQMKAVKTFCENCGADGCRARLKIRSCRTLMFEPKSASLVGLLSYGMAGHILSPVLNVSTGKMAYLNLLGSGRIEFCTFFSEISQIERMKLFWSWLKTNDPSADISFDLNLFNLIFEDLWTQMKDAESPCTLQRKLRYTHRANLPALQDSEQKYKASRMQRLQADITQLQRLSEKRTNQVSDFIFHLSRPCTVIISC